MSYAEKIDGSTLSRTTSQACPPVPGHLRGRSAPRAPFSFAAVEDGRIWFCTATTKDVYRELAANPKFELTAWRPGSGWVIMRGRADLDDRASDEVRRAGFEHMTGLGESYDGPDDDTLAFFTVKDAEAWMCDIDGSWTPVKL